ncbi:MAG: membrane integrity-associated transporter subunit PqiC [Alphaproteobacteria bacterium]|nr:membrane integrity-associated transporter subunit PqiC [Alphaproteobacteria bacterium]
MKKSLILVLVFALTACCSPTPNFYQPTAISEAEINYPNFKKTVLVKQVLLPAEAARPQITTLGKEDFELKIDEFNRWGAAPEKLIARTIAQNLNVYLPKATIERQTPLKKNYQYAVMVEISSLSGRLDDYAALEAVYFIQNRAGNVIKSGTMSEKRAINGDYEAYIPAQSGLLGALSAQIAADLAKL